MATVTFYLSKYIKNKAYKDNWLNTVKGMTVRRLFVMPDPERYGLHASCALKMRSEVEYGIVDDDGNTVYKTISFNFINHCINAFVEVECGDKDD